MTPHRLLVFLAPLGLLLIGCSATSRLTSTYGNKYRYSISMVAPVKSSNLLFRDDRLIIQFRFDDPAIRFQAQNISSTNMRIDWNKASLGIRGLYTPVRNLSAFYDSSAAPLLSPLIPSLGVIRDVILPRGNVFFDGEQWQVSDLLPTRDQNSQAMRSSVVSLIGSTIDVILPVDFESDSRSYRFSFTVDSVSQISWNDYRLPGWLPPRTPVRKLTPSTEEQITAAIIVSGFLGVFAYMRSAKKSPVSE